MAIKIKELKNELEINDSVALIRAAFLSIAEEYGLTETNCPRFAGFVTHAQLKELLENNNGKMFGLFINNIQVGFVAVKKADEATYYMEKLAILPEYRNKSYGTYLLNYVLEYVRRQKGRKVRIEIINENALLKSWYKENDFVEVETKNFEHLPFTVCFLEIEVHLHEH